MNKTLTFLAFVVGFASGAAITATYVKKKYEQIAQEEIDSVKAAFTKRQDENTDKEGEDEPAEQDEEGSPKPANIRTEKPSVIEYATMLRDQGYRNHTQIDKVEEEETSNDADGPRVISPDEFGEYDEDDEYYATYEFKYYSDHVLADEEGEVVHDVNGKFGFDPWDHFGEFEEDSVYVRDDRRKCEYEILYVRKTYADMIKQDRPYEAGIE